MSEPTPERAAPQTADDGSKGPRQTPVALRREVACVFAASVLLTGGLAFVQATVAALAPWVYIAVAAVFVVLPTVVVQRWRREDPVAAGMVFGGIGRGVGVGLVAALLTAIPFVAGYHLWQVHALDGRADPAWDAYYRFPAESRWMPATLQSAGDDASALAPDEPRVWVWTERRSVRVWWSSALPLDVVIDAGSGEFVHVESAAPRVINDGSRVAVRGGGLGERAPPASGRGYLGVDARLAPGTSDVRISVSSGGNTVGVDRIALGSGEVAPEGNPFELERSLLWLFDLLLLQLFFVALPEEYFYRGYVQPTLRRGFRGTGLSDGGVGRGWLRVSHPVWVASVLFALGHVLVDGDMLRLTVFFPSLVFGILRERTGGIVAPITYHGLCNIMVELASVHYTSA